MAILTGVMALRLVGVGARKPEARDRDTTTRATDLATMFVACLRSCLASGLTGPELLESNKGEEDIEHQGGEDKGGDLSWKAVVEEGSVAFTAAPPETSMRDYLKEEGRCTRKR